MNIHIETRSHLLMLVSIHAGVGTFLLSFHIVWHHGGKWIKATG